jgi:hypothetical protein
MVEEIITALSRIRWLFVIARNSSLTYKGQAVDVKQVGRELVVRYVLEGSVRKGGGRVRMTAQLIEAEPARTYGPTASTARSKVCSNCKTRSRSPSLDLASEKGGDAFGFDGEDGLPGKRRYLRQASFRQILDQDL